VVEQPSGTVTFVFTDIAGSTRLLSELGQERYLEVLREHRRVVREAFGERAGYEVDSEGDAFFYAFADAGSAVSAVRAVQETLVSGPIRLRVGVHTGEPGLDPPKYVGLDVHRAARIAAAGSGGQVLLSQTTRDLVDAEVTELGEHRLKDLSAPQRLYQLVIPALDQEFPPLRTLYQTNLPVPATPFIGRERELAELAELLSQTNAGLLTLTGPGGSGKTRLALQAAASVADRYVDGVWWVPLAPLRDPALLFSSVAQAVGLREKADERLESQLRGELDGKRLLLLLDNAEHLLPEIASDIAMLRDIAGPGLVVTSRERLRLQGEQAYPVPALEQPDASELFIARARQVSPGFERTEAVEALCDRLDRLPLALELAAARTAVFTPDQLLQRLGQRLDLLRGDRDADPRQQTLRATIEWSHDLLSPHERELFRRLSVFAGGCTYETAEQVAAADPDTLQSLLDKSLVRRRDTQPGPRYWMLETIREYAAEQLEAAGEAHDMHVRAAESVLRLALEAEPGWRTGDIASARRFLDELANVRAAIQFSLEDDPERALAIVAYFGWVWQAANLQREWLEWIEAARAKADPRDPRLDGYARLTHGMALGESGAAAQAEELIRTSLHLLAENDASTHIYALNWIRNSVRASDPAEADRLLGELDERTQRLNEPVLRAIALGAMSKRARDAGDRATARALLGEAAVLNAHNANHHVSTLCELADLSVGEGDLGQARHVLEQAREIAETRSVARDVALVSIDLACVELLCGNPEAAAPHIAAAREIAEESEGWGVYGQLYFAEAAAHAVAGNDAQAAASWTRARELVPNPSETARLLETRLLEPLRLRPT
jgi:predicted ATPase/class 3 adenylate cyclase